MGVLSFLTSSIAYAMEESEVIGTVPRLLTATSDRNALYEECTLGDALADAMVIYTGADMAIVNGGMLTGNLLHGQVLEQDIEACVAEDCELAAAEVSAAQLFAILEASLAHVVVDESKSYDASLSEHAAFPQISGFRVSYDPALEAGQRLARVTFNNEALDINDSETKYTLVSTTRLFDGEFDTPEVQDYTVLDKTLHSVLKSYIQDGMEDSRYVVPEKRINAMGVRSGQSLNRYLIFTAVVILALFWLLLSRPWRRQANKNIKENEINFESEEIQ